MRVKGFEGVEDMNDKERMWPPSDPFAIKFDTLFPIFLWFGFGLLCD